MDWYKVEEVKGVGKNNNKDAQLRKFESAVQKLMQHNWSATVNIFEMLFYTAIAPGVLGLPILFNFDFPGG